ncbi:MAG: hypothetical protein WAQ17_07425 [Limnochordia bacterium]
MRRRRSLAVLTMFLIASVLLTVGAEAANIELRNEYIRIVVNDRDTDKGRFAVGTTGGDPNRDTDQNKHLIYGGDDPWTSYTTIRVGRQNYVFGGATERRAGYRGQYGKMLEPPTLVDGTIRSCWEIGPLKVWQILSITRGSTTGLMDTARIEYHIENTSNLSHFVGVRLMLDTMLGSNDGAPFRVDDRQIDSDTVYRGRDVPQLWLAFDSLTDPQVISQGTLTAADITPPDEVYFTNWGSLADNVWDFDYTPGRDFLRAGEYSLDSAIAIFWNEKPLAPGESRSYVSYYGLGGVTIAPGDLFVGLHSPKQVTADPERIDTFPITAYIQNTGEGEALDVTAELKLPKGLTLVGGQAKANLGDLPVGEITQISWQVWADGSVDDVLTYRVEVAAENSDPNAAEERITVVSPAQLKVSFAVPERLQVKEEKYEPASFEVKATIRNEGGEAALGTILELSHPFSELLKKDSQKRFLPIIEPGEQVTSTWVVRPIDGFRGGNLYYSLNIEMGGKKQPAVNRSTHLPDLVPKVWIGQPKFTGSSLRAGGRFQVPIWATNIPSLAIAELELVFDPEFVEITGGSLDISQGTLFAAEGSTWVIPRVFNDTGSVVGFQGRWNDEALSQLSHGTLFTVHFKAKQPGLTALQLKHVVLRDSEGNLIDCEIQHGEMIIQPEE